MFCRTKVSGNNTYLQIVENRRDGKKVRQRVIATLGRLDRLEKSGTLNSLVASLCRFTDLTPVDSNGEPAGGRRRSDGRS